MPEIKSVNPPSPAVSHEEDISKGHHEQDFMNSKEALRAYAEHGAAIDHQITQEDAIQAHPELWWSRVRHYMREPFSEFFGVFILILFGDG